MAPSHKDYPNESNDSLNAGCYKHKKFGKRSGKEDTPTAPPLFRPYALKDNTPRKRRQEMDKPQLPQQHQLPPTPPTTPPQQQHLQQQYPQQQHQLHQYPYQMYTPTATPTPSINHQAFAYVLHKQRAVLQMRQMLSINPDANTWPTELRNALYAILQQ